jgi:hypothetical protein
MRDHHTPAGENVANDRKLEAFKSLTDNILDCKETTLTIGPGCAMTLREAVLRNEVLQ